MDLISPKFDTIFWSLGRIEDCESAIRTFARLICNLLIIKDNVSKILNQPESSLKFVSLCHQMAVKAPEVIPIFISRYAFSSCLLN